MSIHVAIEHRTTYRFDRPVAVAPHVVRLRPAPHCRTPIEAYSLQVTPAEHFCNWQQDPFGNHLARYVFPERTRQLSFVVDLVADMTVINPFDFFIDEAASHYPFAYDEGLARDLSPYLAAGPGGALVDEWLAAVPDPGVDGIAIIDFLVELNRRLHGDVAYSIRMEPGVQSPEQTLAKAVGSCRDSAWLLVDVLRRLGLAARFVSGYLVQLTSDLPALDGPSGPSADFTDLHAWTEVYLPGAGWVGMDPTSGLFAGEGHIPLACTPEPSSAAPITGATDPATVEFEYANVVRRFREDPRVTKPFRDDQWEAIVDLGHAVDDELAAGDVRLTMGGEPTFVAVDDMEADEWTIAADGPQKRATAGVLARRLFDDWAPGGILQHGQGKWYPGEPLPRWLLGIHWRLDGVPLWRDPSLLTDPVPPPATEDDEDEEETAEPEEAADRPPDALAGSTAIGPGRRDADAAGTATVADAERDRLDADASSTATLADAEALVGAVADLLMLAPTAFAAHEDRDHAAWLASTLPPDAEAPELPPDPVAWVLPVHWDDARDGWATSTWRFRRGRCVLVPGDSPAGLRLPLASLPDIEARPPVGERSPFDPREPLGPHPADAGAPITSGPDGDAAGEGEEKRSGVGGEAEGEEEEKAPADDAVPPTALVAQPVRGRLHVFLPPTRTLEHTVVLLAAIEAAAARIGRAVVLEGYAPPSDPRLRSVSLAPDPGVLEVNVAPASSWDEQVVTTTSLYEHARQARLATETFDLDGHHTGTGGGNHLTLGGPTPADSPMLRRPDLLRSLVTYWQHHPALSYLFSGKFIGPTSQAPRVDEARHEALYELEIAFAQMDDPEALAHAADESDQPRPWLVDRLLRHLLVDVTGNTHRAEFCIDKLFSPDSERGRLGLVELRAFEMPPHPQLALLQALLVRTLVAWFWRQPYQRPLRRWGTALHDRFLLPHGVEADLDEVVADLRRAGYGIDREWFAPFLEFRFPRLGTVDLGTTRLSLRAAIEPWYTLGEETTAEATSRYVDSSVERLQLLVEGLVEDRYGVTCNGVPVPLHPTGTAGTFVAGVRYRAWQPPSALHPTIGVHAPLVVDLVDRWSGRSLGGCTYHVSHPGGRSYDTFPVNANEAEARRASRFWPHGHTPGPVGEAAIAPPAVDPEYPWTLDLRRHPAAQRNRG